MAQKRQPVIFAASAAVWRAGKVLLVKRGRPPGKDFWSLPGGKVLEETALSPIILGLIGVFEVAAGAVEYQISCFAALSGKGELMPGDDASDARWFKLTELEVLKMAPNTLATIQQSQEFIKPENTCHHRR
jgi:8-oxo-dGTP diphosphatase